MTKATSRILANGHRLSSSPALIVSRKADQLKVEQALFNDYNDRIWLPWNNGGNSFKIHAGFFKISDYHTSGRFKPSAKLMIRQILPVGVILVDFLGCK